MLGGLTKTGGTRLLLGIHDNLRDVEADQPCKVGVEISLVGRGDDSRKMRAGYLSVSLQS